MLQQIEVAAFVLFVGLWLTLGCWASAHAILHKRDPRSATVWLFINLTIPLVGPWLYWAVGINRVERHATRRLGKRGRPFDVAPVADAHHAAAAFAEAVGELVALQRVADRVTRLPLLRGNALAPLHNGEQAYPRMLEAIASAERSITLASYIFDWDDIGRAFADALGEASRRGVRVHVLVDGVGALKSFSRMGRRLLKCGTELAAFVPLRFPFGRIRMNLRNHRKILVIDGHVGFTGGMNISERHLANSNKRDRAEGLHFEVTGPVVAEMQHCFVEDWVSATGETLAGEAYFPELSATGSAVCRAIVSGPDEDFEKIHWMMQAAFSAARHSVRIITPYFVPSWSLISSMTMASLRGVRVSLLLPSFVDIHFMKWVADAYLWQVLEQGIAVYRQPPPFVHTKLMVVDDRWLLMGSANLDRRSFRLNFEFNVEAYDPELASSLGSWIDECMSRAAPVTLEQMDSRSTWQRLRDGTAKLLSPHL